MDSIKILGIEFYAYHGVFEEEKINGQIFTIDCEFFLDTSMSGDDLEKTVNYGSVALDIANFAKENRYDLLESLANELSKHILIKYTHINRLILSIHKPNAPIQTKFDDVVLKIERKRVVGYLGIGSNLGDRMKNLEMVSEIIDESPYINLLTKSSVIETKPYGVEDQPNFLNAVLKIETIFTPYELLYFCKKIEKIAGRKATRRWGERSLDVDILMYGQEVVFTDTLIIPHAEMHIREFVLGPLAEIEPYLVHPIKKENVVEMLEKIKRG